MMKKAIYPGSFDPVTNGHVDMIERASKIVDELVVGVLNNSAKNSLFSLDERVSMLKEITKDMPNVTVASFDGLLVDFMEKIDATIIVRGLRAVTDFEYELQIAQSNHRVNPKIDTVFLTTNVKYSYLSSTIVKEYASYGGVWTMSSRMEQIIEEIEEYIDNCKYQPLSSTKIVVNKDELEELLTELKMKTPEEIKRYQKIISNKEAILADAQAKADAIIAQAQVQTSELVSEHQIMQQAYAQANEVVMIATKQAQEILDKATNDANNIRMGAIQYTDSSLKNIEEILSHAIEGSQARYDNLIHTLQGCLDVVTANRNELLPEEEDASSGQAKQETTAAEPATQEAPANEIPEE